MVKFREDLVLCDSIGRREHDHRVSVGAILWRMYPRATAATEPNHLCEVP